jgi:hypothetical protein
MKPRHEPYYRPMTASRASQGASATHGAVRAVSGGADKAAHQQSVLEAQHPEIVQAVTLLWGYPEMNQYFEKLWLDDGTGRPIAPEAMSELMLLAGVHRWLTPQRPARTMASIYDASSRLSSPNRHRDVWADVPRRR